MAEPNTKIAFVGSHGVGKTTLCYGLASRLKRRDVALEIVHEVARRSPLPINTDTTVPAQRWILLSQIAEELVAARGLPVLRLDPADRDGWLDRVETAAWEQLRSPQLELLPPE